jgi:two-component system chemotaxis response regulator CheY
MVLECNFLEERMKLLVVDDSNIMRRAISKYLGNTSLELVGTAGDGMEALKLFRESLPDLVTMDITMPKMDGLDSLKKYWKSRKTPRYWWSLLYRIRPRGSRP